MTGLDLARSASALYPKLKIMVASGHPVPAGSGAAAIGEFDFIAKPYRLSEIVRKLR
jgi:FixJ family two-component response regulator